MHVSRALVKVHGDLDYRIDWIDSRESEFPKNVGSMVNINVCASPAKLVSNLSDDTLFLVMTHDHDLDFEIFLEVLKRNQVGFLGLIGSKTKAARFRKKLSKEDIGESQISQLVSPVGALDIPGKKPMQIAVSIAAQLIQLSSENQSKLSNVCSDGVSWQAALALKEQLESTKH